VYRGAWQKAWPLRQVIREHQIKTIVALAHPPSHPLAVMEKRISEELGVRWVHLPIHDIRGDDTRTYVSDQLEKAAKIIGDPANQPVFFHCHHGVNRASMAHIAYRTMICGWTMEEAEKEVAGQFGLVRVNQGPDYRHMQKFFDERVVPYRLAQEKAASKDENTKDLAKSEEAPVSR